MPRDLAALIRYHRRCSGLTQQALGELAGVGKNLVYELERGKVTVRWENLLRVLDVLNIQVDYRSPLMEAFDRDRGGDAAG